MCLILNFVRGRAHREQAPWALVLGMVLLAGCQVQNGPRAPVAGPLNNAPIATDGAMDKRQWDVTQANYVNDAVWAHPNYSPLQPKTLPYKGNAVTDTLAYLGNVFYTPVGMFITYPWIFEANKSLALPPTYTLMPALPEGAQVPSTY
jgi:hypothetical protein